MIRQALCLLTLATPALAVDDETLLAFCEPETIAIDRSLLTEDQWAEVERLAEAIPNGTGRLWRVEAPDGAVSHLWGTMHSMDPRLSNVPDAFKAVIAEARIMITEYAGAQATLDDARDWWRAGDFYADRPVEVYRALPVEAMRAIDDRMRFFAIDGADIDFIQPHAMMNLLLTSPCDDRLLAAGYPIQDLRVELLAADRGIPRISAERPDILEVAARQPRWQAALRAMLITYALYQTIPEAQGSFMRLYLDARIGHMMAFDQVYLQARYPALDIARITEDMDDYLLRHRNEQMVANTLPELRKGGAVIAVGAYHLPQHYGLVALLRAEGFTVSRVTLPGEAE